MWAEEFSERLMGWMRNVLCPVGFTEKRHKETMSKSLLTVFHAHIRAPFEIVYRIDLVRQRTKSILDPLDLLVSGTVLELEQYDVAQEPGRHFSVARRGGFALGDMLGLVDMDTACQKNRPGCQTQKIPDHVSLPPVISL